MKQIARLTVTAAIVLLMAFGMAVAGCPTDGGGGGGGNPPSDTDPFAGTWIGSGGSGDPDKLVANATGKSWSMYFTNTEGVKGTYVYTGNSVTITITQVNTILFELNGGWKAYDALSTEQKGNIGSKTRTFTISGNSFAIPDGDHPITFTK